MPRLGVLREQLPQVGVPDPLVMLGQGLHSGVSLIAMLPPLRLPPGPPGRYRVALAGGRHLLDQGPRSNLAIIDLRSPVTGALTRPGRPRR